MKISIDSITQAVEKKFDKLEIDVPHDGETVTVVLSNPIRLPADRRQKMGEILKGIQGDAEGDEVEVSEDEDLVSVYRDLLANACTSGNFDILAGVAGDDAAIWIEVVTQYFEALKVGEASASQN